jgi:hypothetical protein
MLSYRLPREPSGPRTTLWRRLRRLGAAQLSDGLVALPADARTREQLEWLADDVLAAHGTAGVWLARPTTAAQEGQLALGLADARAADYRALTDVRGGRGRGGRAPGVAPAARGVAGHRPARLPPATGAGPGRGGAPGAGAPGGGASRGVRAMRWATRAGVHTLAVSGPLFDGLHEYRRRRTLLGREPA